MKKQLYGILTTALALSLLIPQPANAYYSSNSYLGNLKTNHQVIKNCITGKVILKLKNSAPSMKNLIHISPYSDYFSDVLNSFGSNMYLLQLKRGAEPQDAITALESDKNIDFIQPDYQYKTTSVSSDEFSSGEWGLENIGQRISCKTGINGVDVNIKKAWNITSGSKDVVVGVIDNGIDINHNDLKNNIWVNTKEIPGNGIDDDHNGYIDDVNGWNFFGNSNDVNITPDYDDEQYHATHVAGIIAAAKNGKGTVGVAPNVQIMPLVCGSNSGMISTDDAISAIQYAQNNGVSILNCSWGGPANDFALKYVMEQSGILFICAAGNYATDNDLTPNYPASYNLPNEISVAAIDNQGNLADFSNYGLHSVDVAAPGVGILSTAPKMDSLSSDQDNYLYRSGTSMATPFVSGIAALLYSNGVTDPVTVKSRIIAGCRQLNSLKGKILSGGIVDAYNALNYDQSKEIPGNPIKQDNTGSLSAGENNVFYTDLSAGETINLTLVGSNASNFNADIFDEGAITVKDKKGSLAATDSSCTLSYTVQKCGRYYINVSALKGSGLYELIYKKSDRNNELTIDDQNPAIHFTGRWSNLSMDQCTNKTVKTLSSQGEFSYSFTGSEIKWIGFKSDNQGLADVFIDGTFLTEIDLYSKSTLYNQILFDKNLNFGLHELKVRFTGKTSSGKKQQAGINMDALEILTDQKIPVPSNLKVYVSEYEDISINFDNVISSSVSKYVIYRSGDGVNYTCIKEIPVSLMQTISYFDQDVSSGTYYYKVASMDASGQLSEFTDAVMVTAFIANKKHLCDDSDPAVQYSGNWTIESNQFADGGKYHKTSEVGAKVIIPFSGYRYLLRAVVPCGGEVKITYPNGTSEILDLSNQYNTYIAQGSYSSRQVNQHFTLECVSGSITFDSLQYNDIE